ncbi:HlyD family secretion protein [Halodesulfovibrio spirochaetisodalis]|uniref:RND efflux pump membrane fusion protein barrel-sandwich domain-containing protein n=1 Tax=Halodesulfovibrio spirochaetisodalis TaxID=1560234 RepID=A0A1B7XAW6_9BACT|nr:HlyD family secretion protein [Halodesulfovibrio spirochaetisodalis]OBQ46477.1 hypothetical protein SP90_12310 [Halodesulfovibrio spirochaetisodalis]
MKIFFQVFFTSIVVLIATWLFYEHYRDSFIHPWTRDGQVQANVVTVASRVTGPVTSVHVRDNQYVHAGDLLYTIEDSVFIAAVSKAKAQLFTNKANAAEALDLYKRAQNLVEIDNDALSRQALLQYKYEWQAAVAQVEEAEASLEEAELDLFFSKVYAPVSGFITNYYLYDGTTSTEGEALLSIVEDNTFWVFGYFKETDIGNIKVGDVAEVILMTYPNTPLRGVVQSLGWGIAQDNTSLSTNLLPEVSATFEWIRLAQRIPVRIYLKNVPPNIELRVGTTATVRVNTDTPPPMKPHKFK